MTNEEIALAYGFEIGNRILEALVAAREDQHQHVVELIRALSNTGVTVYADVDEIVEFLEAHRP